jgi:hypothetical protein
MLKVNLFDNKIFLSGKLLHSEVDGLLQFHNLFLEFFNFFVKDFDGLLVLLMLLEDSSQLLLLNNYLVKYRCIINEIPALQLCVTF